MKKLFTILFLSIVLFSCKKETNTKVGKLPTDPELVNAEMDRKAEVFRKGNGHNPHDNPPPPPPPPTTTHKVCLLIDTDGEEVTNTQWSAGTISCASSGLSSTQIQYILNRVRYDYAQFDAEITTDEALYNTYPINKRRKCIITTTNWYGNVGGVAYINSLNWFDNTPCFVFSSLLQYNEKYVSDATSHELGHTANCYHHVELRNDEFGNCYVYSQYLQSNHIMGSSYYYDNPIFTTGDRDCTSQTNDIFNINNSINQ